MRNSVHSIVRAAMASALLTSAAMAGLAQTATPQDPSLARILSYKTLHSFDGTHGSGPAAPLLQGSDGHFYGTTRDGGVNGIGTVFRMNSAGKVTVLHSFVQDGHDGFMPEAALMEDRHGDLYGTTTFGGDVYSGTIFRITRRGEYKVLHSFQGGAFDGNQSYAPLVQAADGSYFGTTAFGGPYNQGIIFRMSHDGAVTLMHSFSGADGTYPQRGIILARDGFFYGTTVRGGDANCGMAFRMSPSGEFTPIYSFLPGVSGCAPSGLIQASNGDFYSATPLGGPSTGGTAFRLSPSGEFTLLHGFVQGAAEGDSPNGLIEASDGNFYGTNANFGSDQIGTIFQITSAGIVTVVHRFSPSSARLPDDGAHPLASPIQARDGALYGTANQGGVSGITPGSGMVYRIGRARSDD